MALAHAHVRIARSTNDFEPIKRFYVDGLGMKVLFTFENHELFDGLILGTASAGYHFEFTKKDGHDAGRAPTKDNLTVFYLPNVDEWKRAVDRMEAAGHTAVPSFNPYWDRVGKTFEDFEGYRICLQNASWTNPEV